MYSKLLEVEGNYVDYEKDKLIIFTGDIDRLNHTLIVDQDNPLYFKSQDAARLTTFEEMDRLWRMVVAESTGVSQNPH